MASKGGASFLGAAKKKGRSMSFVVNDATNVRVFVRVRPFNTREKESAEKPAVQMDGKFAFMVDIETGQPKEERYQFDECFWSNKDYPSSNGFVGQAEIYEQVGVSLLDNAFAGYHACLFAYGQTGAGKSYTMMGNRDDPSQWGMIPRLCGGLFERIAGEESSGKEFKVEVGYIEIYNEKLKDLLGTSNTFTDVKIREHPVYGPSMEGNKLSLCKSLVDINNVMQRGDHRRTIAATAMNSQSSRSHAVFSVLFSQRKVENKNGKQVEQTWFSKINLIDLAGSERVEDSGVTGDNFKEAVNINKSLTTLGRVMDALVELSQGKKGIIPPYRESMLTRMLQDSLGGNSKTMMFANVSPSVLNYEETLSTLRYSSRARNIVNNAKVNVESSGGAQVDNSAMEREMEEARRRAEEEARLAAEAAAARERELLEQARREQEAKLEQLRQEQQQIASRADALAREKSAVTGERDELARDKDKLSRELQQLKQQHDATTSDKNKFSKEKDDLSRIVAELRQQLSDQQRQNSDLQRENTDLSRNGGDLQRSKDELLRRVAELEANVTDLTGKNRTQASELVSLQGNRNDLEAENRMLQAQVRKQTETISELEKRVATERQKSSDYLMQLAEIETSVTRMGIKVPGSL